MLSRALVPEPDGCSECPELLRTTWMPIFAAGAGANELRLPAGVAHRIASGSQLVMQLHLLNATKDPIIDAPELTLEPSHQPDAESVQISGVTIDDE